MAKKEVILVDEKDNEIRREEKIKAHREGRLHRAFSIFIFNSREELLLQKRAKSKYHSAGLWSNTCCSHPEPNCNLAKEAKRRLREEMGIKCGLKEIFSFVYKAKFGDLIEYEFDHVFLGKFDGSPKPDKKEIGGWEWKNREELKKDIKENPKKYTAWFKMILDRVFEELKKMKKKTIETRKEEIVDYLEKLKPEIDKMIEKYLPKMATKRWLDFVFGKPGYTFSKKAAQKALTEPIWDFLNRGGKRWRPVLFLLITKAIGGDIKKVKDFVVIPELIHNGTIILDDIEDQGELRRGKPCLHKIFGEDIALNAGNFLYFLPLLTLIKNKKKFKPEVLVRAYETYIQEMINLNLGQGTDIYWHRGGVKKINEKEYLQMCAFKTGCLPRMTAKLAVILSGGKNRVAEKIGRVAEAMGLAFQIQDDILDITLTGKEREKFGKSFGNDIKEGKRTLMVIHALEKAKKVDKKRLIKILNKHTDDSNEKREAIEIIKKQGSIEYAQKVSQKIIKEAWEETEKLLPPSDAKEKLNDFINYLIERKN